MDNKHISLQLLQEFATKFKAKIDGLLSNKVDKVTGKQLSTEDYTTAEKQKLSGIANGAQANKLEGVQIDGVDQAITDKKVNISLAPFAKTTDVDSKINAAKGELNTKIDGKVAKTTTINGKPLSSNVTLGATDVQAIPASQKGTANGVATLGTDGKVPAAQLPSYVDDIIEGYLHTDGKFYKEAAHTTDIVGESGKVYVDLTTNKTYRWGGTTFVPIGSDLVLGETASTAYAGNKGKANADEIAKIKNGTTVVPKATQANNATTVNGHTVEVNVPANAKFTDTVYTPNFATTGDIDNIITEIFG